jgi:hypothetical protein
MARVRRELEWTPVLYPRNSIELGTDPYCWEVTSHLCRNVRGYVHVFAGAWDGFDKLHRWAYWKETGERPELVMHRCDNPGCINPAHLLGGTKADNQHDSMRKGRSKRLFRDNEVRAIRTMRKSGVRLRVLAEQFGVGMSSISEIANYRTYAEVA